MASGIVDLNHLFSILRAGRDRPLPVVLLLCTNHAGRKTPLQNCISRAGTRYSGSRLRGNSYILWTMCLARSLVPIPQFERER